MASNTSIFILYLTLSAPIIAVRRTSDHEEVTQETHDGSSHDQEMTSMETYVVGNSRGQPWYLTESLMSTRKLEMPEPCKTQRLNAIEEAQRRWDREHTHWVDEDSVWNTQWKTNFDCHGKLQWNPNAGNPFQIYVLGNFIDDGSAGLMVKMLKRLSEHETHGNKLIVLLGNLEYQLITKLDTTGNQWLEDIKQNQGEDPALGPWLKSRPVIALADLANDEKVMLSSGLFGEQLITSLVNQNTSASDEIHSNFVEYINKGSRAYLESDIYGVPATLKPPCYLVRNFDAGCDGPFGILDPKKEKLEKKELSKDDCTHITAAFKLGVTMMVTAAGYGPYPNRYPKKACDGKVYTTGSSVTTKERMSETMKMQLTKAEQEKDEDGVHREFFSFPYVPHSLLLFENRVRTCLYQLFHEAKSSAPNKWPAIYQLFHGAKSSAPKWRAIYMDLPKMSKQRREIYLDLHRD